jgi:hypothetical protein
MFLPRLLILSPLVQVQGQVYLSAKEVTSGTGTYDLINSVLGGTAVDTPDCAHPSFGPHITQEMDSELNRPVFNFHSHIAEDNDRCITFDRQRTEIKTYNPSPEYLKGYNGDTVSFSWNLRLDSAFQPSAKFTHFHQLMAVGGDDSLPLMTITPRLKGGKNVLEIIYTGRDRQAKVIKADMLGKYAGKWIHFQETITYGSSGEYSLRITRLDNGQELMTVNESNIDMWRDGTSFIRPKWGIYRSILEANLLRDEHVYFDSFCLAKKGNWGTIKLVNHYVLNLCYLCCFVINSLIH